MKNTFFNLVFMEAFPMSIKIISSGKTTPAKFTSKSTHLNQRLISATIKVEMIFPLNSFQ